MLQIQHPFVIAYHWISTDDNVLADHLSRGRLERFWAAVAAMVATGVFLRLKAKVRLARDAGRTLGSNLKARHWMPSIDGLSDLARPRVDMSVLSAQIRAAVILQAAARGMLARMTRVVRVYGDPTAIPGGLTSMCLCRWGLCANGANLGRASVTTAIRMSTASYARNRSQSRRRVMVAGCLAGLASRVCVSSS